MGFNFERMVRMFENVRFRDDGIDCQAVFLEEQDITGPALPLATDFLDAMSETTLMFEHLGSAFSFIRKDVAQKINVLRDHQPYQEQMAEMVQAEIEAGLVGFPGAVKQVPPTATRTLLRLMWAVRFIDVLMSELAQAFSNDASHITETHDATFSLRPTTPATTTTTTATHTTTSQSADAATNTPTRSGSGVGNMLRKRWTASIPSISLLSSADQQQQPATITLRDAVTKAYEIALSQHHPWSIRRAVYAAVIVLPSKEDFASKMGISESQREQYFSRLAHCISPMIKRMYQYYEIHHLLDTP